MEGEGLEEALPDQRARVAVWEHVAIEPYLLDMRTRCKYAMVDSPAMLHGQSGFRSDVAC